MSQSTSAHLRSGLPSAAEQQKPLLNMDALRDPLLATSSSTPIPNMNRSTNMKSVMKSEGDLTSPSPAGTREPFLIPVHLPNGGLLFEPRTNPIPTGQKDIAAKEDISLSDDLAPPIVWPSSEHTHSLPRTRSYISMATTIAGAGGSQHMLNQKQQQDYTLAPTLSLADYPEHDYLQLVLQASMKIYDVAIESPLQYAKNLSNKLGRQNKVFLKREELQPVFSFKIRGAYNRMKNLSADERKRGVIAMSAGNHAQGVAMSAQKLGIKATIVMPTSASEIKYTNVLRLGATVILYGADLEEAKKESLRLAEEHGYVFIPPFDDPYIIAGQGTVGMEIIRQMRRGQRIDAIFVPVGGGGLISGIAAFIKRVQPSIRIVGVNTVDSSGMATSLQKGERVQLTSVGLFSDGTAVKLIGAETFRICSKLVDDVVLVTVDEICAAIKDVFDDTRSILEPSGALGVAGIKKFLATRGSHISGANFVAVTSGANMNFDRLRFVAERSRIGEGRECLISCKVDEKPGSFMSLYSLIHPRQVTEVSYRYSDSKEAQMYLAFEITNGKQEIKEVLEAINAHENMSALNITDNDLAKSHLRFLVGGRAPAKSLHNEKLYRFSFPERPGALKLFFDILQKTNASEFEKRYGKLWNLTLVHYRNTGGDVAKILIGMDIPKEDEDSGKLETFLRNFGYNYVEETLNPIYEHFLR